MGESKESENLEEYLDIAREMRKLWNIKVAIMGIIASDLKTIPKNMEKTVEL